MATSADATRISHNVTNFEFLYEPFYVATDVAPMHDERFVGYGFTRNTQVHDYSSCSLQNNSNSYIPITGLRNVCGWLSILCAGTNFYLPLGPTKQKEPARLARTTEQHESQTIRSI